MDWLESDAHLYSGTTFSCKDGSKTGMPLTRVNDDYCDCGDGSDEPGTSACPNGRFLCRNIGHVGVSLHSSRVNDGICGKSRVPHGHAGGATRASVES